jgi:hypothetical protein
MASTQVQGAPQSRFHPLADGAAFSPSLLPDLSNQRNRQLDGKHSLGFWNSQRLASTLGLLKITVSLTPRDAIMSDEPAQKPLGERIFS